MTSFDVFYIFAFENWTFTIGNAGRVSIIWFGTTPRVSIMDPEVIREVLSNKLGNFGKIKSNPLTRLVSTGLANFEGEKWAKHRKILDPAFHQETFSTYVWDKMCPLEPQPSHTFSFHEGQERIKFNLWGTWEFLNIKICLTLLSQGYVFYGTTFKQVIKYCNIPLIHPNMSFANPKG